jgi:hypothetical protein
MVGAISAIYTCNRSGTSVIAKILHLPVPNAPGGSPSEILSKSRITIRAYHPAPDRIEQSLLGLTFFTAPTGMSGGDFVPALLKILAH